MSVRIDSLTVYLLEEVFNIIFAERFTYYTTKTAHLKCISVRQELISSFSRLIFHEMLQKR